MNEFTLMIIFSAVMLMLVVAVHLWAQAKRVGIYAPEQEEVQTEAETETEAEAEAEYRAKYEAESAALKRAIYLEGVYGVDEGYDYCEYDYREYDDHSEPSPAPVVKDKWGVLLTCSEEEMQAMTFIIDRHAISCISEVFTCKDGYTWLALRDELMFSVVYEENDVCHCKVVPGFEWLVFDYIDEGIIPLSMVEVAA